MRSLWVAFWFFVLSTLSWIHAEIDVPRLVDPVMDTAQVLNQEQRAALSQELKVFSAQYGSQIVILTVPTLEDEDIFDYSSRVWNEWKIGRKGISDGVLLVLAIKEHQIRVNPGSGLEGAIPDITASEIIQHVLVPAIQRSDYYGGLQKTVSVLEKIIIEEKLPAVKQSIHPGISGAGVIFIFFILQMFFAFWRTIFGKTISSIVAAIATFTLFYFIGLSLILAAIIAVLSFIFTFLGLFTLFSGPGGPSGFGPGGGFGGFGGGFGSGGGGFSGGGGGFSGGGASGSW